ncbi:hypothetical protein ACWDR5_14350 [Streptomyces koyangensis]|uniref:hypothetical protein n=1 Tax=Streptomyces koyangensis TaxID=188770 RepID=UPI003C2B0320
MGEQRSVRNEFSGEATGPVVQAGDVGRIIFNPPTPGLPPEDLAVYRRLLAREEAKANAEDAAARARQAEWEERSRRMRKAGRRRWCYLLLVLLSAGGALAHRLSKSFAEQPSIEWFTAWVVVTLLLVILTARASYEARTGHRLPWTAMFR